MPILPLLEHKNVLRTPDKPVLFPLQRSTKISHNAHSDICDLQASKTSIANYSKVRCLFRKSSECLEQQVSGAKLTPPERTKVHQHLLWPLTSFFYEYMSREIPNIAANLPHTKRRVQAKIFPNLKRPRFQQFYSKEYLHLHFWDYELELLEQGFFQAFEFCYTSQSPLLVL